MARKRVNFALAHRLSNCTQLDANLQVFVAMACMRLWFGVAQVIAVAEDEREMHVALRQAVVFFSTAASALSVLLRVLCVGFFWPLTHRPRI